MLVSFAIPGFSDDNKIGLNHLTKLLQSISLQDYENIEIVISDHSTNNLIENLCKSKFGNTKILYYKNENNRGFWAANINNAIKNCSGEIIKFMQQDDLLSSKDIVSKIVSNYRFTNFDWAICGGVHTVDYKIYYNRIIPTYTSDIHKGNNKLGGVSSIVIKNSKDKLYFDDYLNWMGDCEYYIRSYYKFGMPKIFEDPFIIYKQWEGQFTNKLSNETKLREVDLVSKKYLNREFINSYDAS